MAAVRTQKEAAALMGISPQQLRKIVAGVSTGTSVVALGRLAEATGFDLHWVVTGKGSPRRASEVRVPTPAPAPALALDPRLFGRLFDALSKVYRELGVRLPESELGAIAAEEYKDVAEAGGASDEEQLAMVRLVAARHRRLLQEEKPGARKRGGSKSA